MRNYIILNGANSNTITGLLIQELAPISKPLLRTGIEEIDGRDGDIITPLGFSSYDKEVTIGLYGDFDINAIIAYFNSNNEGTVIFSNEPDKYYNYYIFDQIDFVRLVRFKTATVTFHCQPFKYGTTDETETLGDGSTVSDEGTNLVLEGSALAPFSQFDLKGNTEQDTLSGKNLLGFPNKAQYTANDLTISVVDGLITINGTATATTFFDATTLFNFGTTTTNLTLNIIQVSGTWSAGIMGISSRNSSDAQIQFHQCDYRGLSGTKEYTAATLTNIASIKFYINSGSVLSNYKFYVQVVKGSTADLDYQPYCGGVASPNPDYPQAVQTTTGEQVVKIIGKNILDVSRQSSSTIGGVNIKYDAATQIYTLNGTGTSNNTGFKFVNSDINLDGTYTLSFEVLGGSISNISGTTRIQLANSNWSQNIYLSLGNSSASTTKTTSFFATQSNNGVRYDNGVTFNNYKFRIQLEKNSQATEWEPYQSQSYEVNLGSIELCKLGDYQDKIYKSGDDWFVRKAIGKFELDGSEDENWYVSGSSIKCNNLVQSVNPYASLGYPEMSANYPFDQEPTAICYSNLGEQIKAQTIYNVGTVGKIGLGALNTGGGNSAVYVSKSTYDATTWRALLSTTPLICYYVLATPTDTQITNQALIEQLDAINSQAHAYKGRTHITALAATGNVPHIIAATVTGNADGTITNSGNIYSKPKLTIFGTGDIGVYLNGSQMFQIALGSDDHITIDTALMEAYKDNLQTLKNRQVTGDYSNFKLAVGSNNISFTGAVTMCVVENYSRWL